MSEKEFENVSSSEEKVNEKDTPEMSQENGNKKKSKKEPKIDLAKTLEMFALTEKKLEETVEELNTTKEAFQRTLAEYDNFRKRTAKEKSENFAMGKTQAVTVLLPILDTLEIALASPCKDEEYKKGIEMVMTTAVNALQGLGVEEITAIGEAFDPNLHAAVMQETVEGIESGMVTKQFQKGYKMAEKIIRPATVAVAE